MSARFSPNQQAARAMLAGDQRFSCLVGGTRSGKTFILVRAIIHRALRGTNSRHAILRFRANAARASISLDTLPTVMRVCFPSVEIKEYRQDGFFELPETGSRVFVGGLDDKERVEKILGLEFVTIFLNEASQIPYSSAVVAFTRLAQVITGLRQRAFVDLNPVGKGHWTNRLFGEQRDPATGKTLLNPDDYKRAFLNPADNAHNLSPEFLASLENLPDRQRKRFYEGVYVDEIDGALWTYELIECCRCEPADIPEDKRAAVVIAVDPSGAGEDENAPTRKGRRHSDEIGIIAAARGQNGDGYILEDLSCREGPAAWARRAVNAFYKYQADCIVAESNFGGAMVEAVLKACDPNVPVRLVTASRGKAVRAEPVSTRYAQKQVHHAGRFPKLEDQLCAFSQSGYNGSDSPDHADAAIWAISYLLGVSDGTGIIEFYRREALERKEEKPHPWEMPNGAPPDEDAPDVIELYVPDGTSHVYGRTGATYMPDADGVIKVSGEDAPPLLATGFVKVVR